MRKISLATPSALLLVAVVAASLYSIIPSAPAITRSSAQYSPITGEVEAGFVGILNFGHWRLICEPTSAEKNGVENVCRINQEVSAKDHPNDVILAANFRQNARNEHTALTMRLPPTARVGAKVALRFGEFVLKIPVRECSTDQCLAWTELDNDLWADLLAAARMQAVLPANQGHRALVDIPVDGLADAAVALNKAQGL